MQTTAYSAFLLDDGLVYSVPFSEVVTSDEALEDKSL